MSLENNALSAHGGRRLSLSMLALRDRADQFAGIAPDSAKPLRLLAAFQEAEPYLGLPPHAFKLIAWLVKMTQAQDWEAGSRPIAWPSAARQQEFLGLTASAVKTLNRTLFQAGVFVLRDSPTGKRYGRRDQGGRIVEAYGFDLSPLAFRRDEFVRLAADARAARARMQALRRRATCARRALAEIGAALAGCDALTPEWRRRAAAAAELVAALRKARGAQDLAVLAEGLERCKAEAESWLRSTGCFAPTSPEEPADRPHTITTESISNPSDTVTPPERSHALEATPKLELNASELLALAPRLIAHVGRPCADWRDVIDAAGAGLRCELEIPQALWGRACLVLGRRMATIALAVVSTKPAEHFTRGTAGYFAGMVKRAGRGELRLDRSLWKLRRDGLERESRSPWRQANLS